MHFSRMAMVSISEFHIASSVLGVLAALSSIVFAGLQQLLCRHYQKQYDMPSNTLLAKTAFAQGEFAPPAPLFGEKGQK